MSRPADIERPKAILFDWDNTLVNTWPVIIECYRDTFASLGETPWSAHDPSRVTEEQAAQTAVPASVSDPVRRAAVVLVVCVDLRVVAALDKDLDRVGIVGGASVYPFVWNILLAARNEGFGGTITTMAIAEEPALKELLGIPDAVMLRSTAKYAIADVTLDFRDGTDIYWARQQVAERFAAASGSLPPDISGGLAPIATPLSDMFMFTIEGGGLSLAERRTLLDWTIRPALRAPRATLQSPHRRSGNHSGRPTPSAPPLPANADGDRATRRRASARGSCPGWRRAP